MKLSLSDLIEELIDARNELNTAIEVNEKERDEYLDNGGMSWGWAGRHFYDDISEAQEKVNKIKKQIDEII